ncbi:MAG: penicillin-insensitive murein endopeptidase [Methyloceanibacter sp.]
MVPLTGAAFFAEVPRLVMRRAFLSLMMLLLCGTVAAEEASQFGGLSNGRSAQIRPKIAEAPSAKQPPAEELFGAVAAPAPLAARAIGTYARGCLAGGVALPINGPDWQVMRLSRNRNWGHPRLLSYLERLANDARALDGWPGLLVGDMAQPRGGPMINGHESHQIGLDADIWLTPMPNRVLTRQERENLTATSMLKDPFTVDMKLWTPFHTRLIKRAASYPEVERIFVHPAIKQVLCEEAGADRAWLGKVRPWWGHYYHFHVRIACPPGSVGCVGQTPVSGDDGCGTELDDWFRKLRQAERKPATPSEAEPTKTALTLDDLPPECRTVLNFGTPPDTNAARARAPIWAADRPAGPPPPH